MTRARHLGLVLALAGHSAACSSDDEPKAPVPPNDGGLEASNFCPNPDEPRVHYRDKDPNKCIGVDPSCTTSQNGFNNSCGCGCIDKGDPLCPAFDDPSIDWVSRDPAKCPATPPTCRPDQNPFSNACGCGCATPGG